MPTTTYKDVLTGVRAIGARTDFAGLAVTDVSAEEDRFPAAIFSQGILKPSNSFVPVKGGASTMNVLVGSGGVKSDYFVVVGNASGQGNYVVRLNAQETVTLDAADAQDRIDEIYLVVRDDAYDSTARALPSLAVRKGDASASPVAPGPDGSWQAYALIATIDVPSTAVEIADTTLTDNRETAILDTIGGGITPVGAVLPYAGANAPVGYLLADGSAKSRTTYSKLFAVIGTTYGAGDGSTTFNLPDLRQRFPLGKAASGTGATLGGTGGAIDHVHTGPSHTHTGPSHTHTISHTHQVDPPNTATTAAGTHDHGVSLVAGSEITGDGDGPSAGAAGGGHYHNVTGATDVEASHTHNVNISAFNTGAASTSTSGAAGTGATGAAGTGNTGTANPPFIALNYIIKAA